AIGLLAVSLFGQRFFPIVAIGSLVVWRDLCIRRVRLRHLAIGAALALGLLITLSIHRSGGTPSLATLETVGYFAFAEFRDFAWSLGYFADPAYRLHGATIPGAIVPVLPGAAWSLVGVDKDALFALNSADVMAALSGAPVGIRVGLIGELYMNFGTLGVAIGMVLFGMLLVWLDRRMLGSDSSDPFAPLLAVTCVLVVFTLVGQLNMFASSINAFGYPIIATGILAARRRPMEGDVGR
ncbi:MAG TPA: O-antigen polysaccharide polymerase Wzy, partial [Gemmatimonadaceae bacterium]|nr:O-antigen polysaccharide polymerase Wzy [Gemmatimonadaceae bacterium]